MIDFQKIVDEWVWANKIHLSGGHPKGIHPAARADLVSRLESVALGVVSGAALADTAIIRTDQPMQGTPPVMQASVAADVDVQKSARKSKKARV